MLDVNFKITKQDIQEYLKQHKEDETIKYREAMFVKYMREQKDITCEALEILIKKYNWEDRVISGTYQYDHLGVLLQESLPNFNSYVNGIQNLDISGICHILIPTLGYYGNYQCVYRQIDGNFVALKQIANNLINENPNEKNLRQQVKMALDDYYFVGKIDKDKGPQHSTIVKIYMGEEHCRKELQEYSSIYGEEPVKAIRKKIRERLR